MAGEEHDVLTVREVAEQLRVSPITLYRLLKLGKLPGAFRMGRVWRINREALERFSAESIRKEASVQKMKPR